MSLPARWTDIPITPTIAELNASPARFNVVPAGRRSLKTETRKRKLVLAALRGSMVQPGAGRWFAAAPTRDQAKRIYWECLKAMVPRWALARKPSETQLIIWLKNGSEIHVLGMDKPERIEGSPWDGGILDEFANMKADAWGANVRPALSDRLGWCDLIGVPEGRNHYYGVYEAAKADTSGEWGAFTWHSAEVLPESEIIAARRDLDPLTFAQEYEASFVNFVGRAYYGFTDENKASLEGRYRPRAPLIFCFDFNVDPGVAVVCQEMTLPNGNEGTGVLGEVFIPTNSTTPKVVARLVLDWGQHPGEIRLYGDATGGSRGTAQTEGSDWDLVKRDLYAHFGADRVSVEYSASNPTERARVNALNTRCENGAGDRHLMVDVERCPNLARDLDGVRLLAGGSGEIDKKHDRSMTHSSDALGYYVESEFPTRIETDVDMVSMAIT